MISHMISAFGQLLKWNPQHQLLIISWTDLALGFSLSTLESMGQSVFKDLYGMFVYMVLWVSQLGPG